MATEVLVTGASGLIGTRVMEQFTADGVNAESIEVLQPGIDLLAPGAAVAMVDQYQPLSLLHLAWVASGTPGYRNHPDNAGWARVTAELARRCVDLGVRFIGTGTVAEVEPLAGDDYTRSKKAVRAELDGLIASRQICWLQPHYVFDPVLGRPEVVAVIRAALASGQQPNLRTPGASHDFIHVYDVAAAIAAAVRAGLMGLVPIGAGRLRSVAEVAAAMGAGGPAAQPNPEMQSGVADITRLRELGWSPRQTEEFFHG